MTDNKYINKGFCIWCQKSRPEVSFNNEPHIIPHALDCDDIGLDICDSCNHYFGTAAKGECNTNLVLFEVFKTFGLFTSNRDENSWKYYRSAYFKYEHKKNLITLKQPFRLQSLTKQFKRSLYEVFLQKYHKETGCGLDKEMDDVRNFARYGIGNLSVHYAVNKIFLGAQDKTVFSLGKLEEVKNYGYYTFWFMSQIFFLEIIPGRAMLMKDIFLNEYAQRYIINIDGDQGIIELKDIRQLDFFMQRWSKKNIDTNNNLHL